MGRKTERYARGTVVTAPDPFKGSGNRPYFIVSEGPRPDIAEGEHTAIPLTTVKRPARVEIKPIDFTSMDALRDPGYASPWTLTSIESDDVVKTVGTVMDRKTEEVCSAVGDYLFGKEWAA